jgi:acyl-coenzyme A thioesterase PaaI-like protein
MKRALAVAVATSLAAMSAAAGPVAVEPDCEQTKLRRLNDKIDGSNSDHQLDRERLAPVSVFAAIPSSDAEYAAVYGATAGFSAAAKADFATARDRLRGLDHKAVDVELGDRKRFDKLLARSAGRVVVIVGHDVDGRFRFVRGGALAVLDMATACAARDAFCVFITCEADKLRPGSACSAGASCAVSFDHASRALQRVAAYAAGAPKLTAKALQDAIRNGARADQRLVQTRHLLADGTVVAVLDTIYGLSAP